MSNMQFNAVIRSRLEELQRKGSYRTLPDTGERSGKYISIEGQPLLNLSSNDYLGLGEDRFLREEFAAAYSKGIYLMTSSSSRLLTGNHPLYAQLEQEIARLYGRDAALVLNSGYHANTGILPALAGRHDLILSDRFNHASIIDGTSISGAAYRRYRHNDTAHLEELLSEAAGKYRQVFIVTESVFSMDGDLADLKKLVELKKTFGAVLIVDEAHGESFGNTRARSLRADGNHSRYRHHCRHFRQGFCLDGGLCGDGQCSAGVSCQHHAALYFYHCPASRRACMESLEPAQAVLNAERAGASLADSIEVAQQPCCRRVRGARGESYRTGHNGKQPAGPDAGWKAP